MAPSAALPSGNRELLKHFKVLKFLGKGSFGSVYKVKRIADGKVYAVKEMDVKSMSQAEREEAVNEVRLLASAKHPNIVTYNEAFLDGNKLCIVMEYASEGDFSHIIKKQQMARKPLSETEIWNYFIQIARGIDALHQMKVLHRDIKPGNIMVGEGRVLKIGDLGIAKMLKHTMAKTQIGTPHYMPPEVWKSRPYAFPSDVWALGCILYEMATFTVPFEARSMSELRYKILRGKFPPISRQYSSDLTGMVGKLLSASPEDRLTLPQILNSDIVRKMEQQIKLETVQQVQAHQMLQTIQVPRNLNMLKGNFPAANYGDQVKENLPPQPADDVQFHKPAALPAIKEASRAPVAPRAAARVPSAGPRAPSPRAPSAVGSGVPSRNGAAPPQQLRGAYAAYGVPSGHPAANRVGASRAGSVYDAQRAKVAPAPRPQYAAGAPPVSRVGSQASRAGQYGQPVPYPPPYMARQQGAPYSQYPFHQSPYQPRNPYAQPSNQRQRPLYHARQFY
eukprot:CAMPEP_0117664870 /NCGR_PEP_ID=MMETSP0804-20121206/9475_1 /TAXON_ID=1074897 /ORGANISM="Tetraselmis astigmatica, Strain CCMP880" /LENGTH=505 /DNA_ID=CAMNT_0005472181 /DNA_START=129 /DNA_END=1646 /DNA_ORIENTATION=+